MFTDFHTHCCFSSDSKSTPEAMIEGAIKKGISTLCFTDHQDFDFPSETPLFTFDCDAYFEKLLALKAIYKERIEILIGVELGLQPHLQARYRELLAGFPFDFVIGSSHLVQGMDPYYPEFFEHRSEEEGYLTYFEETLKNIHACDTFDVYGHIDYIVRYGPNKNADYSYAKYGDILDEILRALIARGKGIELNTAGFKYGLGVPNPCPEVLQRYRELGGEILTIGSDAHVPEHLAYDFARVRDILTACGFSYYTLFRDRKPEFVSLNAFS